MANVYDMIREVGIGMLGENTAGAQGIFDKQQGLADANVSIGETAMPAALAVSGQKQAGELEAQDRGISVRQQLGNDINDPNSLLSILVQDFRENTLAAMEQQKLIAEKKQVSLFDDLPQFLINQVTLPDDINAYRATQGKADAAREGIASMQALTTASAQAANATKQTLTKDSIAQQAILDKAMLEQKLNALKMDSLGVDLEGIKFANHSNAQMVQYSMQEHSMRLQDAAAARAAEQHKWTLDQKKELEAEGSRYAEIVSAGASLYGLPAMGLEEIKSRVKFGTAEQKVQLDKLYQQGMATLTTGSKSVGSSTGEAIWNAMEVGGLKDAQNKPARDYLERVTRDVVKGMNLPANAKMTPQLKIDIQENVNTYLYGPVNKKTGQRNERQGELYKMAADVERPGSIYKAPDLPALAGVPSIKSNPLFASVLSPAIAAGVTKSDPETLLSLALEAEKRGVINRKQLALGISDFYKSATAVAYASSGASKFMLPYRPSYVSSVPASNPFSGSKEQWDFAKPESVLTYVTAMEAGRRLQDLGVMQ